MLYQLSYASLVERETGIGPATNSLEGCDSTTELLPRRNPLYQEAGLWATRAADSADRSPPRSAAGHTSTEYPHLPHFQSPAASVATVNHRPPAILMLSWSRKNRSDLSHCPALNGSASRATCIQQMNYTPDQSSSFGDAPPRPTPTPAAGPTANSLKHIDSKCLIGNWLCSVKSSHAEIHPHPIRLFSFPQLASAPAIHISLVRSRNCRPLRSHLSSILRSGPL